LCGSTPIVNIYPSLLRNDRSGLLADSSQSGRCHAPYLCRAFSAT
jgi:hypothetical protein